MQASIVEQDLTPQNQHLQPDCGESMARHSNQSQHRRPRRALFPPGKVMSWVDPLFAKAMQATDAIDTTFRFRCSLDIPASLGKRCHHDTNGNLPARTIDTTDARPVVHRHPSGHGDPQTRSISLSSFRGIGLAGNLRENGIFRTSDKKERMGKTGKDLAGLPGSPLSAQARWHFPACEETADRRHLKTPASKWDHQD